MGVNLSSAGCEFRVRGFIEDVIDTNYTGAADCEANPLGAMMNGEDCPFNATTKLLFALPVSFHISFQQARKKSSQLK